MTILNLFERLFLSREYAYIHAQRRIVKKALSYATPEEMQEISKYNISCSIKYASYVCDKNVVTVSSKPENFEYYNDLYRSMIHTNGELFNFNETLKATQTIKLNDCENAYALYLEIKYAIACIKDNLDMVKRHYLAYAPFRDDGYMFDDILEDKDHDHSRVSLCVNSIDAFIKKAVSIGMLTEEMAPVYREYVISAFRFIAQGVKVHSTFSCWVLTPSAYSVMKPQIDKEIAMIHSEDEKYIDIINKINN